MIFFFKIQELVDFFQKKIENQKEKTKHPI
jgi:hypothetical protein